jgi:hypothetical protein
VAAVLPELNTASSGFDEYLDLYQLRMCTEDVVSGPVSGSARTAARARAAGVGSGLATHIMSGCWDTLRPQT